MSSVLGGAYVRTGQQSLELNANSLFDKIINLRFIRKSGKGFTIRSDYEPVFHKDGTISFKRCVQKPHIKVTYKQVAESVAISVDIEVANLFVGDQDTEDPKDMNTVEGDPVVWCIVQMGYINQFPNWMLPDRKNLIQQYYDLNNNAISTDAEVQRGRQILVQVLTSYRKNNPPDMITYFKGIVGTLDMGLRWNHTAEELVPGYGDAMMPQGLSEIESALYQFVTRRFIRPSVLHIAETLVEKATPEEMEEGIEQHYSQKVSIYGYRNYEKTGLDTASRLLASNLGAQESDTSWTPLQLQSNGLMTVEDANKLGIVCAVSKRLREMNPNTTYGYGTISDEERANLDRIFETPFNAMVDTIGGQLVKVQEHYPFMRWYELADGNFYFYHVDETDDELFADPYIKDRQKKDTVLLPAVYDITLSGTRTIRCPFISFISPMTTLLFESRYSIGSLVGFYYHPKPGNDAFIALIVNIEFDTDEEANMMEIMCVDIPKEEAPTVDLNTGTVTPKEKPGKETVIEYQEERNLKWSKQELTVVEHKSNATETDSRWLNIVKNDVLADVKPELWEGQDLPDEVAALAALKEWNTDYFDESGEYMKRGNSIENNPGGIGQLAGIKVPWLYVNDKIIVRHPFQPDYPDDQEVAV